MPLQIIGAGVGRTGTRSLKAALEHLGHPTFHMMDLFAQPERVVHFEHAEDGQPVDWEALFAGYTAAVDYPACRHWRTLMDVYPEALVLLTVRDPQRWYDSVMATIYPSSGIVRTAPIHRLVRRTVWDGDFEGRFEDRDFAVQWFIDHTQRVRDTVPAERLLVYEVREGWGPLCAALDRPVPAVDFPRMNTTADFQARLAAKAD